MMKTPLLAISEYRKRYGKFVEEIPKKDRIIAGLEAALEIENARYRKTVIELIALRAKHGNSESPCHEASRGGTSTM